ncbi:MAG TPA: hypothetical protein PLC89_16835 [Haliscomenobacter sp.]|uniref:hypothetical protein n=1 Tax=Haliscomenobacter sp. TaxID=2717303 RepID=UPI002D198E2F|nr:hypothetical protein [Haliscomenobacter sp.]HOY18973.1 hypothetical protein [Haliscomenobacter sp.]
MNNSQGLLAVILLILFALGCSSKLLNKGSLLGESPRNVDNSHMKILSELRKSKDVDKAVQTALSFYYDSLSVINYSDRAEYVGFFLDAFLLEVSDGTKMLTTAALLNFAKKEDFNELNQERLVRALYSIQDGSTSKLFLVCSKYDLKATKLVVTKIFDLHKSKVNLESNFSLRATKNAYWVPWHAAITLAQMYENDSYVNFLLKMIQDFSKINREFASNTLCYDLCKVKSRNITNYIIDEFVMSDSCYGKGDDVIAFCDFYNAYSLPIKEIQSMKTASSLPPINIIRQFLTANRNKWQYED